MRLQIGTHTHILLTTGRRLIKGAVAFSSCFHYYYHHHLSFFLFFVFNRTSSSCNSTQASSHFGSSPIQPPLNVYRRTAYERVNITKVPSFPLFGHKSICEEGRDARVFVRLYPINKKRTKK